MAGTKRSLKDILTTLLVLVIIVGAIGAYIYAIQRQRQAERKLIFIRAQEVVAQEKLERARAYERKLAERRLREEFNRGEVIGLPAGR